MTDGMDLSTFISETIMAVVKGVGEAKRQSVSLQDNAKINPIMSHQSHADADEIHFDIAVAVTNNSEKGGNAWLKLSVPVIGINLGADGKVLTQMANTSRVSFDVKVALPSTQARQYTETPGYSRADQDSDGF